MSKRIAIICSSFDPRIGYQESVFAICLRRLGHEVQVFTTSYSANCAFVNWGEVDDSYHVKTYRTSRYFKYKSFMIPFDCKVKRILREFDPEIVIALAPGHGLGFFWIRYVSSRAAIITGFSDLFIHHKGGILFAMKKYIYRDVISKSKLVITATQETTKFIQGVLQGVPHSPRIMMTGLTYEEKPIEFSRLGHLQIEISNLIARYPKVITAITKVSAKKHTFQILKCVELFFDSNDDCCFVCGGLIDDSYSNSMRDYALKSRHASRFLLLGNLNSHQINFLYSVSSCSLWTQVSIGLQQSLSCGCPVILKNGWSAEHILVEEVTGLIFNDFEDLRVKIAQELSCLWDKDAISRVISRYKSEVMLPLIVDAVSF